MWYKKFLILSIAFLFLFVFPGLGFAQNTTNVTQAGDNNQATIDQTGVDNDAVIDQAGVIYRNPRVYNVDYSFELVPDRTKIDKDKDLKVWIPLPREWDSQKAVKIISVQPPPHAEYEDPEHGNKILFWDFGKGPVKESYEVTIKYRLECFEVHSKVDTGQIGSYDKESETYWLYTRSTYNTNITPEIRELAQTAVGNEKNAYLQAKLIFEFVEKKMHYKNVRRERGSGVEIILDFPNTDPNTGEQYYEGACGEQSVFFVSLCRAIGIPARGVNGRIGWGPWMKKEDLKLRSERHTKLTPGGLAATRLYGPMAGHVWAEFYLPNYGWIPADPTWGRFGQQDNSKLISSKGRDVLIGPYAPQEESEGYGDQWIPIHEGRADVIGWGVWNIAKIRIAKAKVLHHSDPFPADSYTAYAEHLYPESEAEKKLRNWRKEVMSSFYNSERGDINKGDIFEIHPRLNSNREAYLCHLLHQIVGDEEFLKIFQTYLDLRLTSSTPVSIEEFQDIAERIHGVSLDFLFKQWLDKTTLPQYKLDNVLIEKGLNAWRVSGILLQAGESIYRVPIDLVLETEKGQESQVIWLDSNKTDFEFHTTDQPKKLIVDPDYHIPIIRWMPPHLQMLWDFYPDLIVIYGSLAEAEANKSAAESFVDDFAGLSHEIIKVDTNANEADFNTKRVILFGRPETNKITQRFQDGFPIRFEKDKFTWQGVTYDKPTQGVAQIVENPLDTQSMIILYAGLSGDATQKICDKVEWREDLDGFIIDVNSSYIIYDRYKKLASGDWEDSDSDLVWNFE